jgi:hypothetical protein
MVEEEEDMHLLENMPPSIGNFRYLKKGRVLPQKKSLLLFTLFMLLMATILDCGLV